MKENPRAVVVDDFTERLERSKLAVIAEYKGLTVKELETFRRDLREKGAQMRVIKNTLARRALAKANLPACEDMLKGQVAFILGFEDAVGGPQAIKGFTRLHKELKVLGGIFEGEAVGADVIKILASLPNKDQLRSQLLMLLQGPQRRFMSLLEAIPREFVGTLEALAKDKDEVVDEVIDEVKEESAPAQEEATD